MKERLGLSVETKRQRHKREFATFEMLWLLLKIGIDIYHDTDYDGNLNAYVIKSVSGGMLLGKLSTLFIEI